MLEILIYILAFILGILLGILAVLPGSHSNLFAVFALSSFFLTNFSPLAIAIFLASLSISFAFVSFIPAIFLGAPDEDNFLSVLPGHQMLNKGKGYEALVLSLYGCIMGVILAIILSPIIIFIFPKINFYLKPVLFLALIFTSSFLIYKEQNSKLLAILIFFLSGFLGLSVFNLSSVLNLKNSLLPLLTGLFGASSLFLGVFKKQKIPKQKHLKLSAIKLTKKDILLPGIASFLSSPLCAFLPSLGTGQAAVIGTSIIDEISRKRFLILIGSISTIITFIAIPILYSINKARTGISASINILLPSLSTKYLIILIPTMLLSAFFSFFLTLFISKYAIKLINKINYQKLSLSAIIFLSLIVFIFSNWLGFLIFLVSMSVGLSAILLGIRRTHLMGSLMLPSILLYLPFL